MAALSDFSFLISRFLFLVSRFSFLGGGVTGPLDCSTLLQVLRCFEGVLMILHRYIQYIIYCLKFICMLLRLP